MNDLQKIIEDTATEIQAGEFFKHKLNAWVLPGLEIKRRTRMPFTEFIDTFCKMQNVSVNEMKLPTRGTAEVFEVRFIIAYMLFTYYKFSYTRTGRELNRNHSTIIHAVRETNNYYNVDNNFKKKFDSAKELIVIK